MLPNKLATEDKVDTLLSRSQIPIIDLGHCGTEYCPRSVATRLATQLKKALSEKGVAFLVNHGISQAKFKSCWEHLDNFCQLPTDVKEHYIRKGDDNHGYIKPGVERLNGKTPELRHAYNICTLSAASLPEEPIPGFRDHVVDLADDFKKLAKLILQALAYSLELEPNFFVEKHSHMLSGNHDNETTLRLLYYPPVVEDDNKCELIKGSCMYSYQKCAMDKLNLDDLTINGDEMDGGDDDDLKKTITRCGAHCDYGTFTLLAQDSEGGLEVRLPDSQKWQRVGHLPGAILINSGEMLDMWTNGKYPALNHRVVIPRQLAIRSRGRHSLAYFCHPDNTTEIKPIVATATKTEDTTDCKDKPQRKKSFKTAKNKFVNAYQFVQRRFRETYTS